MPIGTKSMFQNSAPRNDHRHNPARRSVLRSAALMLGLMAVKIRGAFANEIEKIVLTGDDATHVQQTLAQMAFRLFPHDNLPEKYYEDVAAALIGRASRDPKLAEILEESVGQLDAGGPVSWLSRSEKEQLDGIRQLLGSEFFRLMRTNTIEHLYRNRAVWELIGYEGSSVEYGGYIDRGFDDIDWLPKHSDEQ